MSSSKSINISIVNGHNVEEHHFDGDNLTIGRSSESQFVIADPNISRIHLKIQIETKGLYITDMGSSNGTYLDGEKITAHKSYLVSPKSIVVLGRSKKKLSISENVVIKNESSFISDDEVKLQEVESSKSIPQVEFLRASPESPKQVEENKISAIGNPEEILRLQKIEEELLRKKHDLELKLIDVELKYNELTKNIEVEEKKYRKQIEESEKLIKFERERVESEKNNLDLVLKLETEKIKKSLEHHLANIKDELKYFQANYDLEKAQFDFVKQKYSEYFGKVQELKPEYDLMKNELNRFKDNKEQMVLSFQKQVDYEKEVFLKRKKEYEEQLKELEIQIIEAHVRLDHREVEIDQELDNLKDVLMNEKNQLLEEQKRHFEIQKSIEFEKLKKLTNDFAIELNSSRNNLIKQTQQNVEMSLKDLNVESEIISKTILSIEKSMLKSFDDLKLPQALKGVEDKKNQLKQVKKSTNDKFLVAVASLIVGVLVPFLADKIDLFLHADSYKKTVDAKIQSEKKEYESRSYNPEKTNGIKDSYSESVLFTKNFVERYSDESYQHQFNKAVINYMFETWRIEEETSIKVNSKVYTLVGILEEKRKNIHPDFIAQNISQMKSLESETTNQLEVLLGSKVKLEAYQKFEKRFFDAYTPVRVPSSKETKK